MTGGGGTTRTKASWMEAELCVQRRGDRRAPTARSSVRSAKSSSGKKMSAALELCVKPLTDMPVNCDGVRDAGLLQRDLRDAPRDLLGALERGAGGSCATATRYCLSCAGMKPPGTALKPNAGEHDQPGIDRERDGPRAAS